MAMGLLAVLALITLGWAGTMFLTLFQIRQIGRGPRYGTQPGVNATLSAFGLFLTLPEWSTRRWLLAGLTVALIGVSVLFYLSFPTMVP